MCIVGWEDIWRNLHVRDRVDTVCVCVWKKRTRQGGRKKKDHIRQRRRLATGSAFSPIFHDTHWTLNARRHRCKCVRASLSMHVWASICSRQGVYKMYLVWLGADSVAAEAINNKHTRPHSITRCLIDSRAMRGHKMSIKSPALIANHRPASSCLSQQFKCNFLGCSFPGCQE